MYQRFSLENSTNDRLRKYLKVAKRKRSNDYYACIDDILLTPAYNYWIKNVPDVQDEVPSLISVNLFSHLVEPSIRRKALEIYPMTIGVQDINPLLHNSLIEIASEILMPLKDVNAIEELARERDEYIIFTSDSLRIFLMASMRIERGCDIEEATSIEEEYFGQKLKYRERFFDYWRDEKTEA